MLVTGHRLGSVEEQQLGPSVDPTPGEHPAVGEQVEGHVGQAELGRHRLGWRGRRLREVLGLFGLVAHGVGSWSGPVPGSLKGMASPYQVRVFGDPVLRKVAAEIDDVDGKLVKLVDDMLETMYAEPGIGLAAPQVGVGRRLFVYDVGEGPEAIVNPVISESRGEWVYEEGCLSVPGLFWEIVRPKEIHLTGYDLDGNEVSIEADELLARLFQHELDHLDGIMLIDHLDDDTRKAAMRTLRETFIDAVPDGQQPSRPSGGLTLP